MHKASRDALRQQFVRLCLRLRFRQDRLCAAHGLDAVALRLIGVLLQLVLRRERLLLHHVLGVDGLHHRLRRPDFVDGELLHLDAVLLQRLGQLGLRFCHRFSLLRAKDVCDLFLPGHFLQRLTDRLPEVTALNGLDVRPERAVEEWDLVVPQFKAHRDVE